MTDTERMESWVLGDERGCDDKIAFEILDVVRWRLLLVLVRLPSFALER